MPGGGRGGFGNYAAAFATMLLLGSCGPLIPPGERSPATKPAPSNALVAGIAPGRSLASYGLASSKSADALASFQQSCPQLLRRQDASGLTRPDDWQEACTAAASWSGGDAERF